MSGGENMDDYNSYTDGTPEAIITVEDVEIYDNDIDFAFVEGAEKYGIEDLTKATQKQFKAVCAYVGHKLFYNTNILKDKNIISNGYIDTNSNKYNYNLVYKLCVYFYSNICDRYNKLMSMEALSLFLGMARDTIRTWGQCEPTSVAFRIYKICKDGRLEGILDDAYDNGNVTGTMFVGNVEYGLNLPGVSREKSTRQVLTTSQLPNLALTTHADDG
jgi:hypothetical protein